MKNSIALRRLNFSEKGSDIRRELTIYISAPVFVAPSSLPFPADAEMAVCVLKIMGFDEPYEQDVIGADLLQALQLATNVDPILKGYNERYDFYFEDGEPYFEE